MKNQEAISELKAWKTWLVLFLRWLLGCIVGYEISLFLFIISETRYPPVLGPIISGQQELFHKLIFNFLYSYFKSTDLFFETSVFLYQITWGVIGALLVSGKKVQKRIGVILLIIYVLLGLSFTWFSVIWFIST